LLVHESQVGCRFGRAHALRSTLHSRTATSLELDHLPPGHLSPAVRSTRTLDSFTLVRRIRTIKHSNVVSPRSNSNRYVSILIRFAITAVIRSTSVEPTGSCTCFSVLTFGPLSQLGLVSRDTPNPFCQSPNVEHILSTDPESADTGFRGRLFSLSANPSLLHLQFATGHCRFATHRTLVNTLFLASQTRRLYRPFVPTFSSQICLVILLPVSGCFPRRPRSLPAERTTAFTAFSLAHFTIRLPVRCVGKQRVGLVRLDPFQGATLAFFRFTDPDPFDCLVG
jgi:hypothetical protein